MPRLLISALAALALSGLSGAALAQTGTAPAAAPAAPAEPPSVDAATAQRSLTQVIQEFRAGAPNYAAMDPRLAEAVKPQIDPIKAKLAELGAVKSMNLVTIGAKGGYLYRVVFANGATDWIIHFGPDKKIDGLFFQPAKDAPAQE
jgi:hypothetical protein